MVNPYTESKSNDRAGYKKILPPLLPGTSFKISQGAFGCCTHNIPGYEFSWDFNIPYGTEVVTVESGKVIQVWEPEFGGGCDKKYNESAHNIKVLHADGTVAQYVHIKSRVKMGELVRARQLIAVTANNGFIVTHNCILVFLKTRNKLLRVVALELFPYSSKVFHRGE